MKILLINSEYPPIGGGAGNASSNIARVLAQRGQDVLVLTSHWDDLPFEETGEGVKVIRLSVLRRKMDRSNALEQISFIFGASFRTFGLIRQFKPDVTLAFFGLPSGAVALLLKWLYRIPYVVSLRGGDVPGFRPYDFRLYHKLAAPFLHLIWKNAFSIIANSKGLRDLALAFDSRYEIPVIPQWRGHIAIHSIQPRLVVAAHSISWTRGISKRFRSGDAGLIPVERFGMDLDNCR